MTQTSMGEIRQRMTALWQEAKSNGFKLEDILPMEMQDHFQNLTELKTAKGYVKELEERENLLQQRNDELVKTLQVEKEKVQNIPDDYKQLQVDYTQLNHRVDFYRQLMQNAEERAENYLSKWQDLKNAQGKFQDYDTKIASLEHECEQQKAIILQLDKENRLFVEVQQKLDEATKEKSLLEHESDVFEEAYSALIHRLENENDDCAAALNAATQRQARALQIKMVTVSELRILKNYYFQLLALCQCICKRIPSLNNSTVFWLREDLDIMLQSASKECDAFEVIRGAMDKEDLEKDEIREQLGEMALTARKFQTVLQDIAGEMFVSRKPTLLSQIGTAVKSATKSANTRGTKSSRLSR